MQPAQSASAGFQWELESTDTHGNEVWVEVGSYGTPEVGQKGARITVMAPFAVAEGKSTSAVTAFQTPNGGWVDLGGGSSSGGITLVPTIADSWKNITTGQDLTLHLAFGKIMSKETAQEFFKEMVLTTIGAIAGGLADAAATMAFRVGAEAGGMTTLYRAVMPGEAADIAAAGVLRNPAGIEVKYFSTTIDGAAAYASQAAKAFGDGPFTFIRVDVPTNLVTSEMRVIISDNRAIQTVVLPSNLLPQTTFPHPVAPPTAPVPTPVPVPGPGP